MRKKTLLLILLFLAGIAAILVSVFHRSDETFLWAEKDREGRRWAQPPVPSGGVDQSGDLVNAYPMNFPTRAKPGDERQGESQAVKDRLQEMLRRDDEGLEVITMPDGHQSIHLKGRFQHVSRLVEAKDGTLVPACGAYLPVEVAGE